MFPVARKFFNTHGIVADSHGCLTIAHTVQSTSNSGDAHGLAIRREGSVEFLYHCGNVKGFVRKTTLDGDVV